MRLQKIEQVVPALFRYVRTDDYPATTMEVTFEARLSTSSPFISR
jgi:hypothetical protein